MPLHDYECARCRSMFEAMVNAEQRQIPCPVCKEGIADRIYRRFGGMLGKNKGKYPYFDAQLGVTLESSQHRDRVAKERGLITMGKQEFDRSRHAPRTPDPWDDPEPSPEFIEMAKRTWDDVQFGRIPVEAEENRVEQILKENDVLNVDKAKEQMKPSTEVA